LDAGIPGVGKIERGIHLCALYSGPVERDDLLMPFVHAGLREGDRCLCLIDQVEPQQLRQRLVDVNDDDHELRTGQLDVDRASTVYLESGRFSAENMAAFLKDTASTAAENEFPHMRVAGEMSWVLPGPPGAEEFFEYESSLNDMDTQIPSVLMCMYDLELFGTSMLVDVLKTHPKVLVGTTVLDNPDFLTQEQYFATRGRAIAAESSLGPWSDSGTDQYPLATIRDADEWDSWNALTQAERRIARLVASGLTNKLMAEHLTLSPHTVDAHLKHIFTKLGIHSRVELTVFTLRQGTRPTS
jgi:DNA-binding CsgD family transcriptional regulator